MTSLIRQQHSNSRLLTSRGLFEAWSSLWGVFGHVQDHLMSFGFKIREDDVGPPRCKVRSSKVSNSGMTDHDIGSSNAINHSNMNVMTECVYGLRYVERSGGSNALDAWRIRQSAVYQKSDPTGNQETWLLISSSKAMQDRLHRYLTASHSARPQQPGDLHITLITIAVKNWRWYIKSLVATVTEQVCPSYVARV